MQFRPSILLTAATIITMGLSTPILDIHIHEEGSHPFTATTNSKNALGTPGPNDICLKVCWPVSPSCPTDWVEPHTPVPSCIILISFYPSFSFFRPPSRLLVQANILTSRLTVRD